MMSTAALTRRDLSAQRTIPRRGRGIRFLISAVLVSLAGAAAYAHEAVRSFEAAASSFVLRELFGYDIYSWRDQLIYRLGEDRFDALALRITVECTSLVVLVPLVLFAAGVLIITRVGIGRWAVSVLVAVAIVFVSNLVRIVTIALVLRELGQDGYAWAHTVVGTAIIAVGTVIAVISMLAIQSHKSIRRRG